ncbi:putative major envelope protein [Selenomonas ruminantium subsp. lactilytica TAM6421]|uniref:Putative major envelope protein n=1 Tax=Selenomonas ruminantium subsp. lactilytica (strain NBRC 103574 / TAM6421) TaxID=927704 RepID=I0GM95_SELRL|nr:putative porin [Selenomonas ruminantium]BAL81882.1 putative major envelope protein [Selenomonas ruminantium subsp. lactilytica TAM6421]
MKKSIITAVTTAMVIGAASTTFAATNPFSDVPADHWAYDAVTQLAADGVIEGYGDNTFKGNRNITRYEMAQMVAKAMAKNTSGADKALVDKLAAEFAEELNTLGVRVSNLERNADKVKWNGEARYTYTSERHEGEKKSNDNDLLFRLEPTAEVNDHWHVKARLDASTNLATDSSDEDHNTNVSLKRIWAEGQYGNTNIKLGKLPMQLNSDLLFDDEISGAAITTGKDLKLTLQAGRWNLKDSANDAISKGAEAANDKTANMQSVGLQYDKNKLSLGAAYHNLNSDAFREVTKYRNGKTSDNAQIWAVNGSYQFDKNIGLGGTYAENAKADNEKKAGSVQLSYKGAQKENKGTWGMYTAYRYLGQNAALDPSYDGAMSGTKGWEVGTNYTLAKNTVATLKYFNGEEITGGKDAEKLFGRVEFFF